MHYTLTLEKGTITLRNHVYHGSSTQASWTPFNPNEIGGWQDGDELIVLANFNLNPTNVPPPPSSSYVGLSAGACNATNQTAIDALVLAAKRQPLRATGSLLGGITESSQRSDSAIFYQAASETFTVTLSGNRGSLNNYKYKWTMVYNGDNTVASGTETELVFGYGDPMINEDET